MKIVGLVVLGLLALLSLAAGGAKIAQMPQEVQFFSQLGLDALWLYPLGALQVVGALACLLPNTLRMGAFAIAAGFAVSSIMIFMTGNTMFGAISLVPAALALLLGWRMSAE